MPTNYWSLVTPVWDRISIYDGVNRFESDYTSSPEVSRVLFAAHWCQSEVCNGGFHQFYSNSTAVLAPEAVAAFRKIGMPETGAVVYRSMLWFDEPFPRDRAVREDLLESHASKHPDTRDPFDDLDNLFFKLLETEAGGFETAANAFANAWQGAQAKL